jgi:hypothetical protein
MKQHLIKAEAGQQVTTWCGRRLRPAVADGEYWNWRGKSTFIATQDERAANCTNCHARYSEWHRRQS